MDSIVHVISEMVSYFAGDARRINHFLKVYGFAKTIGEMEWLSEQEQQILEVAAVTHDIGIKNSEKKHNSSAGKYQQIEGPPEAKKILERLSLDESLIERVCWLIAHHHTYEMTMDKDLQVLVEADFLVNAFEDDLPLSAIENIKTNIFKTATGKKLLEELYGKEGVI
jgi:hypothetical protein